MLENILYEVRVRIARNVISKNVKQSDNLYYRSEIPKAFLDSYQGVQISIQLTDSSPSDTPSISSNIEISSARSILPALTLVIPSDWAFDTLFGI